jgi:Domain of unknown function (DUF4188)
MTAIISGRKTVVRDEPFVVFLIGARVNKWWLLPIALPILAKFRSMLNELVANPESGLLGFQSLGLGGSIQYWKSVEHLNAYAADKTQTHEPVWRQYFKKLFKPEAVGIWHETYVIAPESYECIYTNMPAFGLGKIGPLADAAGKLERAKGRLPRVTENFSSTASS